MSLRWLIAGLRGEPAAPQPSHSDQDADYLRMAYRVAKNSQDPRTQVGCLVTDPGGQAALIATNGFPHGISWHGRLESPAKDQYILHAERALICEAASRGFSLRGRTLYCNWACCEGCAGMIVQAGIRTFVTHQERLERTPERWRDSVLRGLDILRESRVQVRLFRGKIGDVKNLAHGELWEP